MAQLAQLNVGRLLAPIDDPRIQEFVDGLDPINALAEASPGFVWRLQDDTGNATSIRPEDDDLFIVNLSVWTSVETLADFVYRSAHTTFLRRRREWFEKPVEAIHCLWWVDDDYRPTVEEALERLADLRANGASERAFTFRQVRDACPA